MGRIYKVFISHAWHRDEEYLRVVNMLDTAQYFNWRNLSVPEHDPIHANQPRVLEYELRNQIRDVNIFISCAGMWVPRSDWILFELSFARRIGRPIVGVPPWGQDRLPASIEPYAVAIASRQDSLIQSIRNYALYDGQ